MIRDLTCGHAQFNFWAYNSQNAALLEAGAGFLVEEHDRNRDFDLAALGEAQEIDMAGDVMTFIEDLMPQLQTIIPECSTAAPAGEAPAEGSGEAPAEGAEAAPAEGEEAAPAEGGGE